MPLHPLRERGFDAEASEALAALREMTSKSLTEKNPNLPTSDAVVHWQELQVLVARIARLYLDPEG